MSCGGRTLFSCFSYAVLHASSAPLSLYSLQLKTNLPWLQSGVQASPPDTTLTPYPNMSVRWWMWVSYSARNSAFHFLITRSTKAEPTPSRLSVCFFPMFSCPLQSIMKNYDQNQDGYISLQDFEEIAANFPFSFCIRKTDRCISRNINRGLRMRQRTVKMWNIWLTKASSD